jgi:hypothetical protein
VVVLKLIYSAMVSRCEAVMASPPSSPGGSAPPALPVFNHPMYALENNDRLQRVQSTNVTDLMSPEDELQSLLESLSVYIRSYCKVRLLATGAGARGLPHGGAVG